MNLSKISYISSFLHPWWSRAFLAGCGKLSMISALDKLGTTQLARGSFRYRSQLGLVRESAIFLAGKKHSWPHHGCRKLSISAWFVTANLEPSVQKFLVFTVNAFISTPHIVMKILNSFSNRFLKFDLK